MALPTNWVDNSGQLADAAFLNLLGTEHNTLLAAIANADTAYIAAAESTTVEAYANLATVGPSVSVPIGPSGKAIVVVNAAVETSSSTTARIPRLSFSMGGANALAASDKYHVSMKGTNTIGSIVGAWLLKGLNAGTTPFTVKYHRGEGSTATFSHRHIAVIPL